jgi:hypothetical protein
MPNMGVSEHDARDRHSVIRAADWEKGGRNPGRSFGRGHQTAPRVVSRCRKARGRFPGSVHWLLGGDLPGDGEREQQKLESAGRALGLPLL